MCVCVALVYQSGVDDGICNSGAHVGAGGDGDVDCCVHDVDDDEHGDGHDDDWWWS